MRMFPQAQVFDTWSPAGGAVWGGSAALLEEVISGSGF